MTASFPQAILFCCDHNAVRSPMAEGLMKKRYGTKSYVQSAGVRNDMEIDGFAITVCEELDIALHRHRSRSFDQMTEIGDDITSYDLIIALSETSHQLALERTKAFHTEVIHWPIMDPASRSESREAKLDLYRQVRDQIIARMQDYFGPALY